MEKPKKQNRFLPVSLPSTTPVDLFLLAGLPNPLHTRAIDFLQCVAGRHAKVIAVPSPGLDGLLYRQSTVQTLLSGAAQFAARRLKNRSDDQAVRPRRIVLLYVPSGDSPRLLDEFDFFVFPVPLRDLAVFDDSGRQRRHLPAACEQAIAKGMVVYEQELVGFLQRTIESRKSSEPLLLPPSNFHLPGERLKQVFRELTRGTRTWRNAMPAAIEARMYNRDRLPEFLDHQERQMIYRDARGVVFPCARPTELHGAQEIDPTAKVSILRELLRGTYRFGTSLPQGFHHDAQFEDGRQFNQTRFDCSRHGELLVTASHANIYPNDFVRPAP